MAGLDTSGIEALSQGITLVGQREEVTMADLQRIHTESGLQRVGISMTQFLNVLEDGGCTIDYGAGKLTCPPGGPRNPFATGGATTEVHLSMEDNAMDAELQAICEALGPACVGQESEKPICTPEQYEALERCITKVKEKQPAYCEKEWRKKPEDMREGCYNPWRVCYESVGCRPGRKGE